MCGGQADKEVINFAESFSVDLQMWEPIASRMFRPRVGLGECVCAVCVCITVHVCVCTCVYVCVGASNSMILCRLCLECLCHVEMACLDILASNGKKISTNGRYSSQDNNY